MRWRRPDVEVADKCSEATFSLTGEDEAECIEGVGRLRHIGRLLYHSDNNRPSVLQNIRKARQVWGGGLGSYLVGRGRSQKSRKSFNVR